MGGVAPVGRLSRGGVASTKKPSSAAQMWAFFMRLSLDSPMHMQTLLALIGGVYHFSTLIG